MVYHKLVRDRIPEMIAAAGKHCTTEILDQPRYLEKLEEKLGEELAEYLQSKELEELADMLEVMEALVKAKDCNWEDLLRIRDEKREKRGGFEKRILLNESE